MHCTIQQIRSTLGRGSSTVRTLLQRSILIVLVAGATVVLGSWGARGAEPEIVARVNEKPLTRGELQRMLTNPQTKRQLQQELSVQKPDGKGLERSALRILIKHCLILQEAGRRNITVTDAEVDRAVSALRRRFKDLKDLGVWMKEQGVDDKNLFETLRTEMLANRVRAALVEGVHLTEEQVQEYYEAHKEEMKTEGEVRLRIIAVKNRAAAEEILAALQKGENFAALARKRSVGIRAAQGGDTGWVKPQALSPQLRAAIGTMKTGEIGGPLEKDAEFLIIGLAERRPAQTKSPVEARPEIERRLLPAKQQEAVQKWLMEQEKKSKIEVFL